MTEDQKRTIEVLLIQAGYEKQGKFWIDHKTKNAIGDKFLFDESPSPNPSMLLAGFEKVLKVVKQYREYDGQTSVGNHVENEIREILASYNSTSLSVEEPGQYSMWTDIESRLFEIEFQLKKDPHGAVAKRNQLFSEYHITKK